MPSDDALNRLSLALERANLPMPQLLGRSFLTGIMTGLGATVGLAAILWLSGLLLNGLGYFEPLKPGITAIQKLLTKEAKAP
jgi:hypothetical protein